MADKEEVPQVTMNTTAVNEQQQQEEEDLEPQMRNAASYEVFIKCLRRDVADSLKQRLASFILDFKQRSTGLGQTASLSTKRRLLSSFLDGIVHDSDKHLAFLNEVGQPEMDLDSILEGWEKLLMSKVFECVFTAPSTDEARSNYVLAKKIETYSWIEERHLDLNINFNLALEVAQGELLRINGFRAPIDKLIILQNVLQIIVDLIKKKGSSDTINNDSLLPTLILVIIRASPPNMISNVKYIMRYRNPKDMEKGNNQYCITNYMSAISFIYNMEAKSLTLNEEEQSRSGIFASPGKFKQYLQEQSKERPVLGNGQQPQVDLTPNEEIRQFTNQVTGFFGNIFKEVKTTAGEFIKEIKQPSGPPSPSRIFADSTPSALNSTVSPTFPTSTSVRPSVVTPGIDGGGGRATVVDREQYEMELAIAMSLSEMQDRRGSMDISSYSPTKSGMTPIPLVEEQEEEEEGERLVRKAKD